MICPILSQSSRDREGNVLWEHHDCIENACTFWAEEAAECGLRASGLLAIRGGMEAGRGDGASASDQAAWRETLVDFENAQREIGLKLLEGVSALEQPIEATGQEVVRRLEGVNASLLTVSTSVEGRLSRIEERLEAVQQPAAPAPVETPDWVGRFQEDLTALQRQIGELAGRFGTSTRG